MEQMQNKVIWITGASSGIGEACAYAFSALNCRLILTATNQEKLQIVQHKCKQTGAACEVLPYDFSDKDNIDTLSENAVRIFGKIDILFLNAGISQRSAALDTSDAVEEKIMQVNYLAPVAVARKILPHMIENGGGTIAVTTSISGKFGFPLRSTYAASKFALYGYFETVHAEYYDKNIRVCFICPGRVQTDISLNALEADGTKHGKMDDGQAQGISAEKAAKKITEAIGRQKPETYIGGKEIMMVHIKRFFPGLARKMVRKIKST